MEIQRERKEPKLYLLLINCFFGSSYDHMRYATFTKCICDISHMRFVNVEYRICDILLYRIENYCWKDCQMITMDVEEISKEISFL